MTTEPRPRHVTVSLAVARGASVAAAALGAMTLVGWLADVEFLRTLRTYRPGAPAPIAMNPATAACFLLCAGALWAALRPDTAGGRARLLLAGAVVLIAALKLHDLLLGPGVPVDQLLFHARLDQNRMAPNTTIAFLFAGLALLMLERPHRRGIRLSTLWALLAVAVAMLALTGHLYKVDRLFQVREFIGMALNTACGLLLLGVGTLAARPDRQPVATLVSDTAGGVVSRRLLPAAIGIPLLIGWILLGDKLVGREEHPGPLEAPGAVMLFALSIVVVFLALVWWSARSLYRLDLDRARAEQAVADNYRLLRTLIDNLPDYIFVKDADNRFLINNAAHVRVLGYASQADVVGKRDEDCFGAELATRFHDDDAEVIRTGRPLVDREERVVAGAGDVRWVLTTKVPLRDAAGAVTGLVGISHDITERKRAEVERDRFFTLSLDLMLVGGTDGYFKRANPACESVLGHSPAEMTSRPWIEFVHPDDVPRTLAEGMKLAAGAATLNFSNRYRCKDGSYKWLAWAAVPVVGEGLLYCVARDMTQQMESEAQLRRQNELLDEAARSERQAHEVLKRAQSQLVQGEKLASLGQMVAGVAHEINNPLSFVANNVAVLQRDLRGLTGVLELYAKADDAVAAQQPTLAAEIRETAERVDLAYTLTNIPELLTRSREGLRRIQQIVKDLRDFARLDESDLHDVDLNEGIRSTVNIISGVARKKQVKIEMDLAPLPPVSCYPAKVNQVIMNLLANAVQASHEQGTVTVRSRLESGTAKIEVADEGTGIPEDVRGRIFDPFFTTKPPGEGTGLGLSISYGIIQDHGGQIEVQTEMGRGSTFTVTLPVRRVRQTTESVGAVRQE